jgi:hypothetical protein
LVLTDPPFFTGKSFFWSETNAIAYDDARLSRKGQQLFHRGWITPYENAQLPVRFAIFCDLMCEGPIRTVFDRLDVPLRSEIIFGEEGAGAVRREYREGLFFEHIKLLVFSRSHVSPPRGPRSALCVNPEYRSIWSEKSIRGFDTGYPTEKSQDVLRGLIEWLAVSKKTIVVDPFAGSGSTLRAASRLGLTSFGSDISKDAVEAIRKRLCQA